MSDFLNNTREMFLAEMQTHGVTQEALARDLCISSGDLQKRFDNWGSVTLPDFCKMCQIVGTSINNIIRHKK